MIDEVLSTANLGLPTLAFRFSCTRKVEDLPHYPKDLRDQRVAARGRHGHWYVVMQAMRG